MAAAAPTVRGNSEDKKFRRRISIHIQNKIKGKKAKLKH